MAPSTVRLSPSMKEQCCVAESVICATIFLAGVAIGSFLNVVIHRGPALWGLVDGDSRRGGLVGPRSYCPACHAPIARRHLIPLISYLALKGKCAACGAKIPARYPAVELLGGLITSAALIAFGLTGQALAAALFGLALIALAAIDLETGFLPDAITLPLIGAGLTANAFGVFVPFGQAAIGAVLGYSALWLIGAAYERLRGREGLGLGDAKLLAAIGAWTGWAALPAVLFVGAAATLAVVAAAGASGQGRKFDEPIPFGPGLCAAGFVGLMISERMTALRILS
jgi:leader peptidase (prepilin peptidase)/N-methyltransferase